MDNPFEEVIAELKAHIDKRFDELNQQTGSAFRDEMIGKEEASRLLGISLKTLEVKAATGQIPKASGKYEKLRFHLPTLQDWMNEKGKSQSAAHVQQEALQEFKKIKRLRK